LNVSDLGYGRVALNTLGLAALFFAMGLILVAMAKARGALARAVLATPEPDTKKRS
jgi:hypothetical protein